MARTTPTYAEFISVYPGFKSLSKPVIDQQLSLSSRLLDEEAWGDFFSDAVGLDSAHNLTLSQLTTSGIQGAAQGAAGPVTSVSAAGMSVSFAQPQWNAKSASANWYMKTTFGQQFLRLRDTVMSHGYMTS